jgi:hypothetical protein
MRKITKIACVPKPGSFVELVELIHKNQCKKSSAALPLRRTDVADATCDTVNFQTFTTRNQK